MARPSATDVVNFLAIYLTGARILDRREAMPGFLAAAEQFATAEIFLRAKGQVQLAPEQIARWFFLSERNDREVGGGLEEVIRKQFLDRLVSPKRQPEFERFLAGLKAAYAALEEGSKDHFAAAQSAELRQYLLRLPLEAGPPFSVGPVTADSLRERRFDRISLELLVSMQRLKKLSTRRLRQYFSLFWKTEEAAEAHFTRALNRPPLHEFLLRALDQAQKAAAEAGDAPLSAAQLAHIGWAYLSSADIIAGRLRESVPPTLPRAPARVRPLSSALGWEELAAAPEGALDEAGHPNDESKRQEEAERHMKERFSGLFNLNALLVRYKAGWPLDADEIRSIAAVDLLLLQRLPSAKPFLRSESYGQPYRQAAVEGKERLASLGRMPDPVVNILSRLEEFYTRYDVSRPLLTLPRAHIAQWRRAIEGIADQKLRNQLCGALALATDASVGNSVSRKVAVSTHLMRAMESERVGLAERGRRRRNSETAIYLTKLASRASRVADIARQDARLAGIAAQVQHLRKSIEDLRPGAHDALPPDGEMFAAQLRALTAALARLPCAPGNPAFGEVISALHEATRRFGWTAEDLLEGFFLGQQAKKGLHRLLALRFRQGERFEDLFSRE